VAIAVSIHCFDDLRGTNCFRGDSRPQNEQTIECRHRQRNGRGFTLQLQKSNAWLYMAVKMQIVLS
jgi:hypothetical protein